jgi:hypothetical protein
MRARRTGRGSGCVVQQRGTVHHVCSNWLKQPGFVKPPIVEAGFGCGKAGSGRGMDKDEIAGLVQAAEQLAATGAAGDAAAGGAGGGGQE